MQLCVQKKSTPLTTILTHKQCKHINEQMHLNFEAAARGYDKLLLCHLMCLAVQWISAHRS